VWRLSTHAWATRHWNLRSGLCEDKLNLKRYIKPTRHALFLRLSLWIFGSDLIHTMEIRAYNVERTRAGDDWVQSTRCEWLICLRIRKNWEDVHTRSQFWLANRAVGLAFVLCIGNGSIYNLCPQLNSTFFVLIQLLQLTYLYRMASSGMLRRVALVITDVSEDCIAPIIRVTRIVELVTLAVTSDRRTLRRNT
jgi:hypothetical protein